LSCSSVETDDVAPSQDITSSLPSATVAMSLDIGNVPLPTSVAGQLSVELFD